MPTDAPKPEQDPSTAISKWLEAAKLPQASLGALVASLGVVVTSLIAFFDKIQSNPVASALALTLLASTAVLYIRWARRRPFLQSVDTNFFVGARSIVDSSRLFGRAAELNELLNKIDDKKNRYVLLLGEGGSGKTSLLRAGLIPSLEADKRRLAYYISMDTQPVAAVREALLAATHHKADSDSKPPTLVELLNKLTSEESKTIVLVLDHTEEFFTNSVPSKEDRQEFIALFQIIAGDKVAAKLVMALRSDYLDRLPNLFTNPSPSPGVPEHSGEDQGRKRFELAEARVRLEPFTRAKFVEVVSGIAKWDDGLAQAVFADLKVQRVNLALNDWVDVVLPAELQIIGQLITSRHIRDATGYPGKRVLLRDYVSSAINAAPGVEPHRVRELLLSLVPKSGERPHAISLDELARQTHLDRERTKRLLEYLESDYRIVLRQGHDGGAGPDSPQYRLALDFLAQVIREATGANTSRSKRSEALVESARAERLRRLPLRDALHVIFYQPGFELLDEDRLRLRRSLRTSVFLPASLVTLLIAGALLTRFGSYRLDEQQNQIVLLPGLSVMQPILGSDSVAVATGVVIQDWLYETEEGAELLKDVREMRHFLHFLSVFSDRFDVNKHISQRMLKIGSEYLKKRENRADNAEQWDTTVIRWRLSLSKDSRSLVGQIEQRLLNGYKNTPSECRDRATDLKCDKRRDALLQIANDLKSLGPPSPKVLSAFKAELRRQEAYLGDWRFRTAFAVLAKLDPKDIELRDRVLQILEKALANPARSAAESKMFYEDLSLAVALLGNLVDSDEPERATIERIIPDRKLTERLLAQLLKRESLFYSTSLSDLVALGAVREDLLVYFRDALSCMLTPLAAGKGSTTSARPAAEANPATPAAVVAGAGAAAVPAAPPVASGQAGPPVVAATVPAKVEAPLSPPSAPEPARPVASIPPLRSPEGTAVQLVAPAAPAVAPAPTVQAAPPVAVPATPPAPASSSFLCQKKPLQLFERRRVLTYLLALLGPTARHGLAPPIPGTGKSERAEAVTAGSSADAERLAEVKDLMVRALIVMIDDATTILKQQQTSEQTEDRFGAEYHTVDVLKAINRFPIRFTDFVHSARDTQLQQSLSRFIETYGEQSAQRSMPEVIRAARRLGMPLRELEKVLPSAQKLLSENDSFEQNVLNLLSHLNIYRSGISEALPVIDEYPDRARLADWITRYIERDNDKGCQWAAVALYHHTYHRLVDQKIFDMRCQRASNLHYIYARARLLSKTENFDDIARTTAFQLGDSNYHSESAADATGRLLAELEGDAARRSLGYRHAIHHALVMLARSWQIRDDSDPNAEEARNKLKALRARLEEQRRNEFIPFYVRLNLTEILVDLTED